MTAFILGAGDASRVLTCGATLIANRFIGRAILSEFNAILCACRQRSTILHSMLFHSAPLLSHVDPPFVNIIVERSAGRFIRTYIRSLARSLEAASLERSLIRISGETRSSE